MASVTLFHSAYGRRSAVLADAEHLRAHGHVVSTPDLYRGAVFDNVHEAMAHFRAVGEEAVLHRAREAVGDVSAGHVFAGFSLGGGVARWLVERYPECGGALFLSSAPAGPTWPTVPAQAHVATGDEWVDEAEVSQLVGNGIDVFRYDGGHLFADPDLPDYDAASASLMWGRVLEFLGRIDS